MVMLRFIWSSIDLILFWIPFFILYTVTGKIFENSIFFYTISFILFIIYLFLGCWYTIKLHKANPKEYNENDFLNKVIIHFSFFALFSAGIGICLHTIFSAYGLWADIIFIYFTPIIYCLWWYIEFYDIFRDYEIERLKYELFKCLDE